MGPTLCERQERVKFRGAIIHADLDLESARPSLREFTPVRLLQSSGSHELYGLEEVEKGFLVAAETCRS